MKNFNLNINVSNINKVYKLQNPFDISIITMNQIQVLIHSSDIILNKAQSNTD